MKRDISLTETLDVLAAAPGLDALDPLLLDLRDAYGLANIVYHATHLPGCAQTNPILMLSYDPVWVGRYVGENYFDIDPVVQAGRRGFLPIDRSGLDRSSSGARHLFTEAESHGVGRQGITIPIRGPNGERAIFTLTSNICLDPWERSKPSYLREYHAVAHFFHERAVRLGGLRGRGCRGASSDASNSSRWGGRPRRSPTSWRSPSPPCGSISGPRGTSSAARPWPRWSPAPSPSN